MLIPELDNFFLASAGAGGALVGLLFVAVSLAPKRTVASEAPVERQVIATSAYTAFVNAFFISVGALIPGALGLIAFVLSVVSLASSFNLLRLIFKRQRGWLNLIRRGVVVLESFVLYGFEAYYSALLTFSTPQKGYAYALAGLLLGIYGIGLTRAWQLLGAPRWGLFGWLSPLRDIENVADE